MAKGLISIFALPQEIDTLHLTLYNLRRNAEFLPKNVSYTFDITFCVSDELIDWNKSILSKKYFIDKFNSITETLCKWAPNSIFRIEEGDQILGCDSQRIHSLRYIDDYDFTMWLDSDLFFNDKFLGYLGMAVNELGNHPYYVITPQITRQWDASWDVLVNDRLLDRPFDDNLTADVFELSLLEQEVGLKEIPVFKAAGGWGTTISNKLLKRIGIPKSLGHYGLADTYVMNCAQMLKQKDPSIIQIVLDGMLVCENHSQQTSKYLKPFIHNIDRKDEFRQISTKNYQIELERFYNENILQNK